MKETRTTILFQELKSVSQNDTAYQRFLHKHRDENNFSSLHDFLTYYLSLNPTITIPDIIFRSNLSQNYVYPILNGKREHPSKYKLTALCIGAQMNLKETQRALTLSGCANLHPKISADAGIIICINNGCNSVMEVEEFLLKNGVASPFGA